MLAADWQVTGAVHKIVRCIWEVGVAGSPVIGRRRGGAFSTLLRRSGLRASSDGVLATKSERKMLASTSLYSLHAWYKNWKRLSVPRSQRALTLYPATDCTAATDIFHVDGH